MNLCTWLCLVFIIVVSCHGSASSLSAIVQNEQVLFQWVPDINEAASYIYSSSLSSNTNLPFVTQWITSCKPGTMCLYAMSTVGLTSGYYVFFVYDWNYVTGSGSWSPGIVYFIPVVASVSPSVTPVVSVSTHASASPSPSTHFSVSPSPSKTPQPSSSPAPTTGPGPGYVLQTTFSGSTFFSGFNFYTGADPTHGFVQYVSSGQAASSGLIQAGNPTIIKSDNTSVTPAGRPSIRLESFQTWNSGLFIMDLNHMPAGCGTWPAWWLLGPSWPAGGEIDIIEGVNLQGTDLTSLHTTTGCTMAGTDTSIFTGTQITPNCDVNAPGQASNQGCGTQASGSNNYGASFNSNGGGVYMCELLPSNAISVWFFPRNRIPSDVSAGVPFPANWGKPYAKFPLGSNCPTSHFSNLQMIIDLTFCGDWAGAAFGSQCSGTCNTFVQDNPSAFTEAFWSINSIKVYQRV